MNTKKELRTHWLEHRLTLGELQKNTLSYQIQEFLFSEFSIQKANCVHIFLPVHEKCEVRTWSIIHYIKTHFPQVQICSPRIVDMERKQMESILLESQTTFVRNKWGIEEPELGVLVEPFEIDIILLPLITFDVYGHRLGYGGGYYDRYLPYCVNATKIGLSYFEPVSIIPETNKYDVKMNSCITPEKVFKFT